MSKNQQKNIHDTPPYLKNYLYKDISGSPKDFAICMSNKIIWHIGKAEKSERGQGILPI